MPEGTGYKRPVKQYAGKKGAMKLDMRGFAEDMVEYEGGKPMSGASKAKNGKKSMKGRALKQY